MREINSLLIFCNWGRFLSSLQPTETPSASTCCWFVYHRHCCRPTHIIVFYAQSRVLIAFIYCQRSWTFYCVHFHKHRENWSRPAVTVLYCFSASICCSLVLLFHKCTCMASSRWRTLRASAAHCRVAVLCSLRPANNLDWLIYTC